MFQLELMDFPFAIFVFFSISFRHALIKQITAHIVSEQLNLRICIAGSFRFFTAALELVKRPALYLTCPQVL